MVNRVVLVGRLTKDPVIRKTQTGKSVLSYTVAINRRYAQNEQADFINCVAWEKTAEIIGQYARKGSLISVEGRIQSRSYDDKDGKRVYVTEVFSESVQLLESKADTEARSASSGFTYEADSTSYDDLDEGPILDISSDDLPF